MKKSVVYGLKEVAEIVDFFGLMTALETEQEGSIRADQIQDEALRSRWQAAQDTIAEIRTIIHAVKLDD